jgi:HlyD family secretion protein
MHADAKPDPGEQVRRVIGADRSPAARRLFAVGVMLLLLVGAGFGVQAFLRHSASKVPEFETKPLVQSDIQVTVRATGTLQALTTVEVGAEVTGRVIKVNADTNSIVRQGEVLAEIDPEQLRAAVEQAAAQVAAARAAIALATATLTESLATLARSERMAKEGVTSQSELDGALAAKARAEASLASATANATLARAALQSARSRLEKTTIVSPIDGVVLSRLVEPGQTVTAGFTTPVLFRLAQDLTRMRLTVDIDEADVGKVHEGREATFTVEAYPERKFASRVVSLYNEPKTSQNVVTYQAILEVSNTEKLLKPGMTCTATIISDVRRQVLAVPNAALRFVPPQPPSARRAPEKRAGAVGEAQREVWVLRGAEPVAVKVRAGASDGVLTELLDAGELRVGDQVLVDVKEPP